MRASRLRPHTAAPVDLAKDAPLQLIVELVLLVGAVSFDWPHAGSPAVTQLVGESVEVDLAERRIRSRPAAWVSRSLVAQGREAPLVMLGGRLRATGGPGRPIAAMLGV